MDSTQFSWHGVECDGYESYQYVYEPTVKIYHDSPYMNKTALAKQKRLELKSSCYLMLVQTNWYSMQENWKWTKKPEPERIKRITQYSFVYNLYGWCKFKDITHTHNTSNFNPFSMALSILSIQRHYTHLNWIDVYCIIYTPTQNAGE